MADNRGKLDSTKVTHDDGTDDPGGPTLSQPAAAESTSTIEMTALPEGMQPGAIDRPEGGGGVIEFTPNEDAGKTVENKTPGGGDNATTTIAALNDDAQAKVLVDDPYFDESGEASGTGNERAAAHAGETAAVPPPLEPDKAASAPTAGGAGPDPSPEAETTPEDTSPALTVYANLTVNGTSVDDDEGPATLMVSGITQPGQMETLGSLAPVAVDPPEIDPNDDNSMPEF
jgi:hypothetical protein